MYHTDTFMRLVLKLDYNLLFIIFEKLPPYLQMILIMSCKDMKNTFFKYFTQKKIIKTWHYNYLYTPFQILNIIEDIISSGDFNRCKKLSLSLAYHNLLDILKWAHEYGINYDTRTGEYLAQIGNLEILEWAYEALKWGHESVWVEDICSSAAFGGHKNIIQWARNKKPPFHWDEETFSNAAANGDLNNIIWLAENGCPYSNTIGNPWNICDSAANCGKLHVLEWLFQNGIISSRETCCFAARAGHLNIVEWLCKPNDGREPIPCDKYIAASAAHGGHLNILEWVYENDYPWDTSVSNNAGGAGKLNVLIWLHEHNCPLDKETCILYSRPYKNIIEWLNQLE